MLQDEKNNREDLNGESQASLWMLSCFFLEHFSILMLLVAYSMSFCLVGDPDRAGQSAESD